MTQTTDLATLLALIGMVAVLLGIVAAYIGLHLHAEAHEAIGASHHCKPGTCPACDSFGTWA